MGRYVSSGATTQIERETAECLCYSVMIQEQTHTLNTDIYEDFNTVL